MKRILYASAAVLALACSHQRSANDPGTGERAGKKLDEGAEAAKGSAQRAGEKVGRATEKAGQKLKEKSDE